MDGLRGLERQGVHDRLGGIDDAAERREQRREAVELGGEHQGLLTGRPDQVAAALQRHHHTVDFRE